jgi:hypothetical protein
LIVGDCLTALDRRLVTRVLGCPDEDEPGQREEAEEEHRQEGDRNSDVLPQLPRPRTLELLIMITGR